MKTLDLKKPRDLGQILSDTFLYIRIYYKSLLKPFLVYVLPPLLLTVLFLGGGFGSLFSASFQNPQMLESDISTLVGPGLSIAFGIVAVLVTTWMLLSVIHQHLRFAAKGDIPSNLGEFSKGMFSKSIIIILTYMGIGVPAYLVFFVLIMLLQEMAFLAILVFFPFVVFVIVRLLLFPTAYYVEDLNPSDAIRRSWNLTQDNFWFTFGLYIVVSMIFAFLSYLFIIPLLIILSLIIGVGDATFGSNLGILMGLLYGLLYFFQLIFSSAQFISLGLHYFNLRERKDGTGLREQIEQLG